MIKKLGWGTAIFIGGIILFMLASVAPIDDTPLSELETIQQTRKFFQQFELQKSAGDSIIQFGWHSVNITPRDPIDMAGYGPRGPYLSVLDSLHSKCIVVDNGNKQVAIISIDLLMFPRIVKHRVEEVLSNYGFSKDEIYLSATHTHNGFGNFEQSIGGELIFGNYDEDNVDFIVSQIVDGVATAIADKSYGQIGFSKIDANELVINRVDPANGNKDPFIRVIHLNKDNGEKGMLISFSGHAVNMDADTWEISRDYPGVLVDYLENDDNLDFAMFCAGMVGSHNININVSKGHERIHAIGAQLSKKILRKADSISYSSNYAIASIDLPIDLPPSQLRLTDNLRLRDWIFRSLLNPLEANIKVIEIGDILLIGMPCDYSGELSINHHLDVLAATHDKNLFITSFNGNYIGYITEDAHYYACHHDEVMSLNWVGPYKGAYFTELIKEIIRKN
jgi:hypothetical protein